ncbi:MAG: hypothetical protein EXQ53_07415 [Acidobacteria bacterium]|nr:hypothetical protein [Acidobacteriota bacterium]
MRVITLVVASVLLSAGSAFAQDWAQYINKDDGFSVDFPGAPRVTETTFKTEYGLDLPARVYRVVRGPERYSVTVADYTQAPRLLDEKAKTTCPAGFSDERACGLVNAGRGYWKEEIGGAITWATFAFLQRDARVTHLAWAWQDLVEGHELQLTNNADRSRTFAFVTMHQNRLYIAEATVPAAYPPPGLFQQSMGFVDKDGRGVRYQSVYSNMHAEFPEAFPGKPNRTGQGRGGGAAAPAPPPQAPGR